LPQKLNLSFRKQLDRLGEAPAVLVDVAEREQAVCPCAAAPRDRHLEPFDVLVDIRQ
jgi:hypothetical protein